MKIRRFLGKDMRDALAQVKEELGGEAVIMSNKKVADGVEIVAAYDQEPTKPKVAAVPGSSGGKKTPTLSEIIGDSGPDSLKALLEKQSKQQASEQYQQQAEPEKPGTISKVPQNAGTHNQHLELDSQKLIKGIHQELKSLRNVLQFQVSGLLQQEKKRQHPLHSFLTSRLEQMGISGELAEEVVSYAPEDADERQAWLFLLKLLANRLNTTGDEIITQGGVVALIGPTGTGKTTTVAKLAAKYAKQHGADKVGLVTIDSYRIGAFEQLATYGKIIGCAVRKAHSSETLADVLLQFRNKSLVLIDTAGFGQRDIRLINQLDTFKKASCATIKKYLVLQANSQHQVLSKTIKGFSQVALKGCIFTKVDESYSLGEAISASIQQGLAVSYVTDGQKVPEDIKVAEARYLISTAAKLYKAYAERAAMAV